MPSYTAHDAMDACRCDDYFVLPRDTPIEAVVHKCYELGCHGFSRNSRITGRGKFYIRSPSKSVEHLEGKMRPASCTTFYIVR